MKSCFFTGQRSFSYDKDTDISDELTSLLTILAENGVTDFYSGVEPGWDMFCSYAATLMRTFYYRHVKLHAVLPCPPEKHSQNWTEKEKSEYEAYLKIARSIEIVSNDNDKNSIEKRDARLVQLSDVCICYFDKNDLQNGTAQSVIMAEKANKIVFNLLFSRKK